MKKSLLIAAAVMITFGACTNDDSAPVQNEISFKAINYKSTKAAINDAYYPNTVSFGVFAYYLPGSNWDAEVTASEYWDANGTTASEYMNDVNVSYDGATTNIFKPAIKYYWPNQGFLTFVAYSPSSASADYDVANKKLTISNYSCENVTGGVFTAQQDLMYSKAADAVNLGSNGIKYNDGTGVKEGEDVEKGVQIKFRHALSQIRFYAKPEEASTTTQFNVLKVVLKSIPNQGNLTVVDDGTPAWNVPTDAPKKSFTTYDATATTPYDNHTGIVLPMNAASYTRIGLEDNNLLVIPQTFKDVSVDPDFINEICEIEVTYRMWVNGTIDAGIKTKSVLVSAIIDKFEPNKIYKMNFSISADEIRFAPQIVAWDQTIEGSGDGKLK